MKIETTQAAAEKFRKALEEFDGDMLAALGIDPILIDAMYQGMVSQYEELLEEIEYERQRASIAPGDSEE